MRNLKKWELTNRISCAIMFVLQKNKSHFNNFRGVAKVVSRQFRVLETVGSSPAASTKK